MSIMIPNPMEAEYPEPEESDFFLSPSFREYDPELLLRSFSDDGWEGTSYVLRYDEYNPEYLMEWSVDCDGNDDPSDAEVVPNTLESVEEWQAKLQAEADQGERDYLEWVAENGEDPLNYFIFPASTQVRVTYNFVVTLVGYLWTSWRAEGRKTKPANTAPDWVSSAVFLSSKHWEDSDYMIEGSFLLRHENIDADVKQVLARAINERHGKIFVTARKPKVISSRMIRAKAKETLLSSRMVKAKAKETLLKAEVE